MNLFTTIGFLQTGGLLLVLSGILGYIGVLGPTQYHSFFGSSWWLDNTENLVHFIIGLIALVAVYTVSREWRKKLTIIIGVFFLLVTFLILGGESTFNGAVFQKPGDMIFHGIFGVWALYSVFGNNILSKSHSKRK